MSLMPEGYQHTLISTREALKILSWVSYAGLYRGCKGTDQLTRFRVGHTIVFSKEECERLAEVIRETGRSFTPQPSARSLATEHVN